MLSKLKSKKKKNKQNILIAYNKSIASIQGVELAMLFCHAGFSVKTILLDGAEEHISSEILKEITGHTPWSNLHKPNWLKAEINYPVGIIIGASDCFTNTFVEYIKEHCGFIKILVNKESALNQDSDDIKKQIIFLPDNLLNLRSLFEKILSETVALIAAKTLEDEICYRFEGDLSKIDYVKELEKAFAEGGIEKNWIATPSHCSAMQPPLPTVFDFQPPQLLRDSSPNSLHFGGESDCENEVSASAIWGASIVIISNGKKEIEVVLEADEAEIKPTKNRIYIFKHKNGLILNDSIETRLLPDLTCQRCFSRLVNYLKVELTKLDS